MRGWRTLSLSLGCFLLGACGGQQMWPVCHTFPDFTVEVAPEALNLYPGALGQVILRLVPKANPACFDGLAELAFSGPGGSPLPQGIRIGPDKVRVYQHLNEPALAVWVTEDVPQGTYRVRVQVLLGGYRKEVGFSLNVKNLSVFRR